MQYSPKLKKAMEDIKSILKKYDIAGMVILHTPGNSEYFIELNPSYSCAKSNGDSVRIKAKLQEDFHGDKQAREKNVADTTNMFSLLSEVGMRISLSLSDVSERLDKIVNAEHFDGCHSSQTEQNN